MKHLVSIIFAFSLITLTQPSFANPAEKVQGGIKDVILSPLQISENVKAETKNAKFLPFALTGGLLKGTFYMAKKIVTGTLCVVTAPLEMIHK